MPHFINHVTKDQPCDKWLLVIFWEHLSDREDHESIQEWNEWENREDSSHGVLGICMMDPIEDKVAGNDPGVVWEP